MLSVASNCACSLTTSADAYQGKIRSIGAAGHGIDGTRPGRAIAGPEHVNAHHAVIAGLQQTSIGEQPRPPISHRAEPESAVRPQK